MNLSDRYKVDPAKLADGVEMPLGDAFVTVSYFNSTKCRIFLETKAKIYSRLYPIEEVNQKVLHEVLVDLIILGWRNLKEDGEDIPYSKENAKRLLIDYPGLDSDIMDLSAKIEAFKREAAETTKGK